MSARAGGLGADRVGSRGSVGLSAKKGFGTALHEGPGERKGETVSPNYMELVFTIPSHTNASQRKKLGTGFFPIFALFGGRRYQITNRLIIIISHLIRGVLVYGADVRRPFGGNRD